MTRLRNWQSKIGTSRSPLRQSNEARRSFALYRAAVMRLMRSGGPSIAFQALTGYPTYQKQKSRPAAPGGIVLR
jgi:hypothetical protein